MPRSFNPDRPPLGDVTNRPVQKEDMARERARRRRERMEREVNRLDEQQFRNLQALLAQWVAQERQNRGANVTAGP